MEADRTFENLNVWREAMQLRVSIYGIKNVITSVSKNNYNTPVSPSRRILQKDTKGKQIKSLYIFYILHEVLVENYERRFICQRN